MKKRIAILTSILILIALPIFAQTIFKEIKAGHTFNISLPDYMSKSIGMNAASTLEYKNIVKGVFGIVICDSKEELELAKIQSDIELAKAKKEALESQKAIEALYNEAIKVMKEYSGREDPDCEDIQ